MPSSRFSSRRLTASPAPKTLVRGITIPLGNASWSSWRTEPSRKHQATTGTAGSTHLRTRWWQPHQGTGGQFPLRTPPLRQARRHGRRSWRNSRSSRKSSKRSVGRLDCYEPRLSRSMRCASSGSGTHRPGADPVRRQCQQIAGTEKGQREARHCGLPTPSHAVALYDRGTQLAQ